MAKYSIKRASYTWICFPKYSKAVANEIPWISISPPKNEINNTPLTKMMCLAIAIASNNNPIIRDVRIMDNKLRGGDTITGICVGSFCKKNKSIESKSPIQIIATIGQIIKINKGGDATKIIVITSTSMALVAKSPEARMAFSELGCRFSVWGS